LSGLLVGEPQGFSLTKRHRHISSSTWHLLVFV
jgi:hypothetical protein